MCYARLRPDAGRWRSGSRRSSRCSTTTGAAVATAATIPTIRVSREIDDLDAVLQQAGGSAMVFGISSGAALAARGRRASCAAFARLALYEAPFIVDQHASAAAADVHRRNARRSSPRTIAATRSRSSCATSARRPIGVFAMSLLPFWKKMKAIAHTLAERPRPSSRRITRAAPLSRAKWAGVTMPVLVMAGGKSPAYMQNGMRHLADVLPNAHPPDPAGPDAHGESRPCWRLHWSNSSPLRPAGRPQKNWPSQR